MVSQLWTACSEGNLETVLGILNDASSVDIEIRDHTGSTPLIEAVKNGHVDVVKVLLDRGADPSFTSVHGRPEMYTSDPTILELFNNAQNKPAPNGVPVQEQGYTQDSLVNPAKPYYPVPAGPYAYYPGVPPMPTLPDGSPAYYPQPPMQMGENGGFGNLPPPEVARFIPCRYFPACRYGSSCLFAHPQAGPYYSAPPPPPAQYPAPYDPMTQQPYAPNYYAVPPPAYHPPSSVPPHINPASPTAGPVHASPHPPIVHTRSGSEAISPVQVPFSPSAGPAPVPYGAVSPVSPSYPPPSHVPLPLSIPSLPPPHQPPSAPGPQSPQTVYPNGPISAPPFAVRQDPASYQSHGPHHQHHHGFNEANGGPKPPPHNEGFGHGPVFRQGVNHNRRGSMRRGSFGGSRKPACLFYPAGRCRNGDDCRFPHVLPDVTNTQAPHFNGRGPRSRDNARNGPNGIPTIDEKMANLNVREDAQPRVNGTAASSRSQSTDGSRSRGTKSNGPPRAEKKTAPKQRVPNADEFPVLGGSTNSSRSSVNGSYGPTAAQVLQAPAPARKDTTKDPATRAASPEQNSVKNQAESKPAGVNGVQPNGTPATVPPPAKLPLSFAAAATGTAPEVAKEVSVSA